LVNHGAQNVLFTKGDKIAQIIIEKISTPTIRQVASVEELGQTVRGKGGFGSTDVVRASVEAVVVGADTPVG